MKLLIPLLVLIITLFQNAYSQDQDKDQDRRKNHTSCLKQMAKKIQKESSFGQRKKHALYPLYKALKGAIQILPKYEVLNLNATFENKENEIKYLNQLLSKMNKYDSQNFSATLKFYEKGSELTKDRYYKNTFFKTLLVLKVFDDQFCSQELVPSPKAFNQNIKDIYDNLFGVIHEKTSPTHQLIQANQLLLGSKSNEIETICQYDANQLSFGKQYLDLQKTVQKAQDLIKPSGPQADTCPVCFEDFDGKDTIKASLACGDPLCVGCLKEHIKAKAEDEESSKVPCVNPKCQRPLKVLDNSLDKDMNPQTEGLLECIALNQFNRQFYKDNRFVKCPNGKCEHFLKKLEKEDDRQVNCPGCEQKVCLFCGNSHKKLCPKKTNILRKKQLADDENMRLNGLMDCPYCLAWVQKEPGTCSRVVCNNCKNPFDFLTGGAWDQRASNRSKAHNNGRGYNAPAEVSAEIKKDPSLIYDRNVKGMEKW